MREGGALNDSNTSIGSNSLACILTVTLCGLPEMILTVHEVIRNIASSFSTTKINGNGLLSCVPDEWSLRCHTTPFTLTPLVENSEEWTRVLTLGK
jgi:hypothetical protein